ncbi:MAG: glycosyltransferase [Burkholderiaceae bacterium]
MPVYDPPIAYLIEAIESVRAQIYPHWELCIADDRSTDPAVAACLRDYASRDDRIKVAFRDQNGHICHASNSALALVRSDYVGLLDQDDVLPVHALWHVARAIAAHPDVRLLYSDEDKLTGDGRRTTPYFKPDWNLELLRSQNLISHFGVYHTALVRELGGFRPGLEGSQDYDLALRCVERLRDDQIVHIPHVLYHWRIHRASTSIAGDRKPYAATAAARALSDHLARCGIDGRVEDLNGIGLRVHYPLPSPAPLVSLIVPTRDRPDLLRRCIDSFAARSRYPNVEWIIVDNGSAPPLALDDPSVSADRFAITRIRHEGPPNASALYNRGVAAARGEFVVLLNDDIELISPDGLAEMVSVAMQPGVGVVGARQWYPDDTLQHAGFIMGMLTLAGSIFQGFPKGAHGDFGRAALRRSLSAVSTACCLVRRRIFLDVGGLDEVALGLAFYDLDFCLRVREAGYRNMFTPFAECYRDQPRSRGADAERERPARFPTEAATIRDRWAPYLRHDPCYNPNLALDRTDYALAWPPRVEAWKPTAASDKPT